MLATNQLTIKDSIFDYVLIHNLSISLQPGDKIALIGSEGTGKSTLLKYLAGQSLDYVSATGDVYRQGHIVYTEQNIHYRWKDHTVYGFLFENNIDRIDHLLLDAKIHLHHFGLYYDDIIDRKIKDFSGGEKVKLSLVKALIQDPDILLMDEPTNDLDFETISFLEDFLLEIQIPLMFISHDQRLLEHVANGIVHIQHVHKQRLCKTYIYHGDYLSYKDTYYRNYENQTKIALKQRANYEQKLKTFRQIYSKVEHQQNQAVRNPSLARLLKKKIHHMKSQEKRFEKEKEDWLEIPEQEAPMHIFFDDLGRTHANKRMIEFDYKGFALPNNTFIKHISLHIQGQDKVLIYGKNGVGKSSLMKALIKDLDHRQIQYAYIPQNYMDLLEANTRIIDYLRQRQDKYSDYRLRQILGQLGFKRKDMHAYCQDLSEGQKLKVLLLLMVSKTTEILLLDEPTRNISPINQDEMYHLFKDYPGSILAISHDRAFIEFVFDDTYELTEQGLSKK